MTTEQISNNKAQVLRFFKAMNEGDIDTILDSYAEDGMLQTMGNTLISGQFTKAQIAAAAQGIYQAFPEGISFTITGMTAEGDKVAVEATSSGAHSSGSTYSNEYHFLFTFADGKISSLKEYMDTERVTDILCGGQRPERR
jgi:ketosteroid isomerase-like protein